MPDVQQSKNIATLQRPLCQLRVMDNGVVEFVMQESSRAAVDDLMSLMEELTRLPMMQQTPATLLDSRVGIQPLNYIMSRMSQFAKAHPSQQSGRLAMILPPNPLVSAINAMTRGLFPRIGVRIFTPNQYDEAIQWLTKNQL